MHQTTKYQTYLDKRPSAIPCRIKNIGQSFTLGFWRGLSAESFFAANSIDWAALNNSFSAMYVGSSGSMKSAPTKTQSWQIVCSSPVNHYLSIALHIEQVLALIVQSFVNNSVVFVWFHSMVFEWGYVWFLITLYSIWYIIGHFLMSAVVTLYHWWYRHWLYRWLRSQWLTFDPD